MNELLPSAGALPGTCLGCRTRLRSGVAFCSRCGLRVGEAPSPRDAWPPEATREVDRSPGWEVLKPALQLFACMLAFSFAGMIAYRFTSSPWIDVAVSACDAVLILGFLLRDLDSLRPAFGPPRSLPVPRAALAVSGAALVLTGYFAAFEAMGVPLLESTEGFLAAGWPIWSMVLLISLYPAVFEELAFRGVIQGRLERSIGTTEALLVQAGMFSVLHLMPMIFPSHFLMGLLFGWLRRESGSLYPGMAVHAAWNAWIVWQELAG